MAFSLPTSGEAEALNVSKKKILEAVEYNKICDFIQFYPGLAIDCELELNNNFGYVHRLTLKSILQTEWSSKVRSQYKRCDMIGKKYLNIFENKMVASSDTTALIKIANAEGITPVNLCRGILQEKYKFENKSEVSRLLKYPHLIEDPTLAANVMQCICSDSQDGPLVDMRRRVIGEEYELKLKEMAKANGIHYYDEHDLRRFGYDKTPDLKIILPFMYKGEVINWIESKAIFGDVRSHKWYIRQQLNSYSNRFGTGIVIYWFGYHEDLPMLSENGVGIIVLDDFPEVKDIRLLSLEPENDFTCTDGNDLAAAEFL